MSDDKPTHLTPEEARQGEGTGRVRNILLISVVLAVVALVVVFVVM